MRVRISDLAIEQRLGYREAYDRALKGEYGSVVREGAKLFVVKPPESDQPQPPKAA